MKHWFVVTAVLMVMSAMPVNVYAVDDGEVRSCVPANRIKSTTIIDDQHIVFDISGGGLWMNALRDACPRLADEGRFKYDIPISQLCNGDVITVIRIYGLDGPTCALSKFSKLADDTDLDKLKQELAANQSEGGN